MQPAALRPWQHAREDDDDEEVSTLERDIFLNLTVVILCLVSAVRAVGPESIGEAARARVSDAGAVRVYLDASGTVRIAAEPVADPAEATAVDPEGLRRQLERFHAEGSDSVLVVGEGEAQIKDLQAVLAAARRATGSTPALQVASKKGEPSPLIGGARWTTR
jgi:hypothetical protein